MGKGDKRSFRGKIVMGTYGKNRLRKPVVANTVALVPEEAPVVKEKKEKPVAKPKATPKKAVLVKEEATPKKKVVKKAKPKEKDAEE